MTAQRCGGLGLERFERRVVRFEVVGFEDGLPPPTSELAPATVNADEPLAQPSVDSVAVTPAAARTLALADFRRMPMSLCSWETRDVRKGS
jgi:hypothetical protein